MAWLAERIREARLRCRHLAGALRGAPGVEACSPSTRAGSSRTAAGRPEPAPCGTRCGACAASAYALDTTHPEVLEWLREVARTLARDWGYRVLEARLPVRCRAAGRATTISRATRAQALRRGLEAIRAGAGEDVSPARLRLPAWPGGRRRRRHAYWPRRGAVRHNWLSCGRCAAATAWRRRTLSATR